MLKSRDFFNNIYIFSALTGQIWYLFLADKRFYQKEKDFVKQEILEGFHRRADS